MLATFAKSHVRGVSIRTMTRCAIYVYWDSNAKLQSFADYFLMELAKCCDKIIVVVNGVISDEGLASLSQIGCSVLVRDNVGYDFAAYRDGLKFCGWENIKCYDEVILCNSSFYGPIYSIEEVFTKIDPSADFWGITSWKGQPWPDHIQSYFLVFRKTILLSKDFETYWEKLKNPQNRDDAIRNYEVVLTEKFSRLGFKWTVLIDSLHDGDVSINQVELALSKGMPFIKRKFFDSERISLTSKQRVLHRISKEYPILFLYEDIFAKYCYKQHALSFLGKQKEILKNLLPVGLLNFYYRVRYRIRINQE